jgi:hypothetical protein
MANVILCWCPTAQKAIWPEVKMHLKRATRELLPRVLHHVQDQTKVTRTWT